MADSIKLTTDSIFNETMRDIMGTSAKRLAPDRRSQNTYPLSIVICLSKVSLDLNTLKNTADTSQKTLTRELSIMTERFRGVMEASVMEMSDIFSALNPEPGDSAMIDIDCKRPETELTRFMANSLGTTEDIMYITAGFTLDTTRIINLMKLLGRLDSIIIPGYIKYFRLYRVELGETYLIGNDGELFSSYCREVCTGNPTERTKIDKNDSRYINVQKIFKRTFCTKKDIRESVHQAFDESYNELCAEFISQGLPTLNGQVGAQLLSVKLLQKLKDIL